MLSGFKLKAQDIHLSHIHASPLLLNPAMTGLFNGDLRFMADYRSQWQSVTKGYTTVYGAADMKMVLLPGNNALGGGLQFYSDQAGDLNFRTNSANFSLSGLRSLNGSADHYLSVGLQAGIISHSVNYANIVAFDPEPGVLNGAPDQFAYLDVSAGLAWFYAFDKRNSMYLGTSLFHVNNPHVSFFERNNFESTENLYRRFVAHGGGDFKAGEHSRIMPSFIFLNQGPHQEISVGSFWNYQRKKGQVKRDGISVYFGAWYRFYSKQQLGGSDALITAFRIDANRTFFTFTFDVNLSKLAQASNGRGGPEVSIIQIVEWERRKKQRVNCPVFYF